MRSLQRNRRTIYYANFVSSQPAVDEFGNETGERIVEYGEPELLRVNISSASGEAVAEVFGSFTDYSRTISVTGPCPLVEGSHVWFGISTDKPHNYEVVRAADSLNGTMFALREVTVS